jgi:hypothetical protein
VHVGDVQERVKARPARVERVRPCESSGEIEKVLWRVVSNVGRPTRRVASDGCSTNEWNPVEQKNKKTNMRRHCCLVSV